MGRKPAGGGFCVSKARTGLIMTKRLNAAVLAVFIFALNWVGSYGYY
jgi:hypothetical protein